MPRKKIVEDSYYSDSDDSDGGIGLLVIHIQAKQHVQNLVININVNQKNLDIIQKRKKLKEVIDHIKHVKKMKMQVLIPEKEEEL